MFHRFPSMERASISMSHCRDQISRMVVYAGSLTITFDPTSGQRSYSNLEISMKFLGAPVTKILERGQKWNGVPIFPCKIWHGQENNGMTIK